MPEQNHMKLLAVIGKNIGTKREAQGLSKTELAEMIGYNRNDLYHLECGFQDIRFDTFLKIAKALDVRPSDLCSRDFDIDNMEEGGSYIDDDYLEVFSENAKDRLKSLKRTATYISSYGGKISQTTISRVFNKKIKNPRISIMNEIAYWARSDFAEMLHRKN